MLQFALAEDFGPNVTSDGLVWLEALPARVYHTPMYGQVPITIDKLNNMVKGFKDGVRGQDIAVNFSHGLDVAKGDKAAGWYKDFAVKPSSKDPSQLSLYAAVEFTDTAKEEIKAGEWKYFSMEWEDLWGDNAGNQHTDVIVGGALTNRPIAKDLAALPINFSETQWIELDDETKKQFAVWTTAYVNSLPDSAFLYVEQESGEAPEGKGVKETPKEDRHLPYKDASGKVDLAHLRNAIARIPQMTGISSALKNKLQAKARSILAAQSKNMSEEVLQLIESDVVILTDESREWEHSEPGTGPTPQIGSPEQPDPGVGQRVPRIQGDPAKEDPAIGGGWRREPLPVDPSDPNAPHSEHKRDEGGSALTPEELAELKKKLGLAEDADVPAILAEAEKMFSETATLKNAVAAASKDKKFAEEYPTQFAEHQRLLAENRESHAIAFSESIRQIKRPEGDTFVGTDKGLSTMAVEAVRDVHKKFAEGTATDEDFQNVIKAIVNGGIVDFSEQGSTRSQDLIEIDTNTPGGVVNARKLFAEKVAEIQKADKLDYQTALDEAAKKFPDLAAAYRVVLPA